MCKFCSFIARKNNDVLELIMFNAEERLTENSPDSHSRIVEVKLGNIHDNRCNKYEYGPSGLIEDSICDDTILFEDVKDKIEKFSKTKEFLKICTVALSRGENCMDFIPENKKEIVEKILNEYACQCAESVLHIFEKEYPEDRRPRQAVEMKRKWMKGEATWKELKEARDAAYWATGAAYLVASRATELLRSFAAEAAGKVSEAAESTAKENAWAEGAAGWAAGAAGEQEKAKQAEMLRKLMEEIL